MLMGHTPVPCTQTGIIRPETIICGQLKSIYFRPVRHAANIVTNVAEITRCNTGTVCAVSLGTRHRVRIIAANIITANNLIIRESSAAKHRMRIIHTAVNNSHRKTCSIVTHSGFSSICQRYRLSKSRLNVSNRLNMLNRRIGQQSFHCVTGYRT